MGTIYFESYRTNDQKIDALQMPLQGSYLILDKKNKLSIDFAFITSILIYSQFNFYEDEQHSFITNTFEKTTSFDKKIDCSVASGFTFKPNQKIAFRLSYEYDLATNFLNRSYFSEDVTISNDYELHTSGLEFEIIYQLTDKINPLTDKVNKLIGEINQFTDKVKTKN